MPWLDRDRIWRLAWALVPVFLLVDLVVGLPYERAMRLSYQAATDAEASHWDRAARRYEAAAAASPDAAVHAHNASIAHLARADREAALRWNREALRRDPEFAPALRARARLERMAASPGTG